MNKCSECNSDLTPIIHRNEIFYLCDDCHVFTRNKLKNPDKRGRWIRQICIIAFLLCLFLAIWIRDWRYELVATGILFVVFILMFTFGEELTTPILEYFIKEPGDEKDG